ncbi:MAG: hypothetical protein GX760_04590 [Erysipelothrix sp.]|nr:hypothetical protein [Erysipelothrix sp.]
MIKLQSKYNNGLIILLTITMLIIISNTVYELQFARIFLNVDSLQTAMTYITFVPSLQNSFIVRLALSMSDLQFSMIKVIQSIPTLAIMQCAFSILLYDVLKYFKEYRSIRLLLRLIFIVLVLKYVVLFIIVNLTLTPYINLVMIFQMIALVVAIASILILITSIIMYILCFIITIRFEKEKRESDVRIIK